MANYDVFGISFDGDILLACATINAPFNDPDTKQYMGEIFENMLEVTNYRRLICVTVQPPAKIPAIIIVENNSITIKTENLRDIIKKMNNYRFASNFTVFRTEKNEERKAYTIPKVQVPEIEKLFDELCDKIIDKTVKIPISMITLK